MKIPFVCSQPACKGFTSTVIWFPSSVTLRIVNLSKQKCTWDPPVTNSSPSHLYQGLPDVFLASRSKANFNSNRKTYIVPTPKKARMYLYTIIYETVRKLAKLVAKVGVLLNFKSSAVYRPLNQTIVYWNWKPIKVIFLNTWLFHITIYCMWNSNTDHKIINTEQYGI